MSPSHSSRYVPLVADLARQALAAAEDCTPHAPRAGESVVSCTAFLPVARAALGAPDGDVTGSLDTLRDAAADPGTRFTDGIGHSREVYRHLVVNLARVAGRVELDTRPTWPASEDLAAGLWRCVAALGSGDCEAMRAQIDALLSDGGRDGSLQRQTPDDSPDHWTFRELAGLHALDILAEALDHEAWRRRVREVAEYHQGHTQPDYTTYQPWGLAVFARDPATSMFAEQQLHDVETHLNLHGGGGAVIPALLLTDATVMLSG